MSLNPRVCKKSYKVHIPMMGEACEFWLITVTDEQSITNPDKDHAYLTDSGKLYIYNGKTLIQVNRDGEWVERLGYLEEEFDVLEARMDQFTSLEEGSTTGDAELQDIRVGYNGTTYKSAGEAVRSQIQLSLTSYTHYIDDNSDIKDYDNMPSNSIACITASTPLNHRPEKINIYGTVITFDIKSTQANMSDGAVQIMVPVRKAYTKENFAMAVRMKWSSSWMEWRYLYGHTAIDNLIEQLNTRTYITGYIKDTSIDDLIIEDKFITANGSMISSDNFSIYGPIAVDSHSTIIIEAAGYDANVAMISKYKDGKYIPLVISDSRDVKKYQITVDETCDIVFSFNTTEDHTIAVIPDTSTFLDEQGMNIMLYEKYGLTTSPSPEIIHDHFIQSNGQVSSFAESWGYTNPIPVIAQTLVTIEAAGYDANVAMISKYKDGKYIPLVISDSRDVKKYQITVDETCDIVFSFNTTEDHTIELRYNIPESLKTIVEQCVQETTKAIHLENYVNFSVFQTFGVIGDSYASGAIFDEQNKSYTRYEVSWGQILARNLGNACVNFSSGGLTTRSWLTHNKGLSLLNSTDPQDIYLLVLGINDYSSLGETYLGSESDIVAESDTFYGNYSKIINAVKSHAPHAKIILFTIAGESELVNKFNTAIINIANHFGIPYIVQLDDDFFTSDFYTKNMVSGHPTAIGYSGMASAFNRLLNKCIMENFDYFKYIFAYDS